MGYVDLAPVRDNRINFVDKWIDEVTRNCVLYLPLYKLPGASFKSLDAYGHLATVTGALWTPQGRTFDGLDDNISIPDAPSLSFGDGSTDSPFSVGIWVKIADISADGKTLVCKWDNDVAFMTEWLFNLSASRLYLNLFDGATGAAYIGRNTPLLDDYDDMWMFLYATYDGSRTSEGSKIYLDASRIDNLNISAGAYTAMHDSNQAVLIGARTTNAVLGQLTKGTFGEVWTDNRVLTLAEIQRIYNLTKWRYR